MKRDYRRFGKYVTKLSGDVYAQPPDEGHTAWATSAARALCSIPEGCETILDVGCGQGFMQPVLENELGLAWTGVTIGEDYRVCEKAGLSVREADMSFLPFKDNEFDLIFARHVLEHSPFPVITLMEWRRVCKGWMILISPSPDMWGVRGRNHYAMLWDDQLEWLLERSGWNILHETELTEFDEEYLRFAKHEPVEDRTVEYRMLCEQIKPIME